MGGRAGGAVMALVNHVKAESLCQPDDYDLRGTICKELAELYFEEKNEIAIAKRWIQKAKFDNVK